MTTEERLAALERAVAELRTALTRHLDEHQVGGLNPRPEHPGRR